MAVFDEDFEFEVLSQCMRDEAYLKKAVRICEAHHFGSREASWVWSVIASTWNSFRERVNGRLILARALDEFPEEPKRKPYLALALKLLKKKPTAPKAALEELGKFVDTVNIQLALEEGAQALEKGDLEKAKKSMYAAMRDHMSERQYVHIDWFGSFEERLAARKYEKEHPDEFTVVPTGIPQLDKALGGGARLGEVGLIMGTTGRGKSICLNNISFASLSRQYPTVYFALEMHARQVATRQDARWSLKRYDQFKTFDFKPSELREIEAKRRRFAKKYKNMFHILSMPVKSADIRTIRGALDDLREEFDFIPKVVCIDSGDHMKAVDKSLESYRLQQAEVYWDLKALAEEQGYVLWSTVHAGREWAHQIATAEATSESYDKARIADLIVTLNDPNSRPSRRRKTVISEDEEDEEEPGEVKSFDESSAVRPMEMYLAKYRDGVSKLKIDLSVDFSRMLMKETGEKEAEEKPEPDEDDDE